METEGMEGMAVPSMPNVFFSFPDEGNRPSGTYVYVYVYVYIHVCVCVRVWVWMYVWMCGWVRGWVWWVCVGGIGLRG